VKVLIQGDGLGAVGGLKASTGFPLDLTSLGQSGARRFPGSQSGLT
jgi:hypothetical protein